MQFFSYTIPLYLDQELNTSKSILVKEIMYFLKNKIGLTTFRFSGSEICLGYENRMLIKNKCLVSQNTTSIVCIFI